MRIAAAMDFSFRAVSRAPVNTAASGRRTGVTYAAVKITPQGSEPFEVWFDPSTHLIAREIQLTGTQPQTFIMSNYAHEHGVLVPKQIITRVGNDPKFDTVSVTSAIDFTGPQLAARYAPPPAPPNSAHWPQGKDSVTLPIRLINNHIYVDASIDDHAPVGVHFRHRRQPISWKPARHTSSAIPVEGALPGGGFGDKVAAFGFAKVKSVSLNGLTLRDQVFSTVDLSGLIAVEGADQTGLAGIRIRQARGFDDRLCRTHHDLHQTGSVPSARGRKSHSVHVLGAYADGVGLARWFRRRI